jgi:hypothetical protein
MSQVPGGGVVYQDTGLCHLSRTLLPLIGQLTGETWNCIFY